jgi:DME family drug/metabolite transporter
VAVYRSIALVLLAASLWGTTGTAAFFLGSEVPPAAIGAATMGIGGIILALVGSGRTRAVVADPGVRVWLVFGALGAIVYPLTFYQGMASAGIALGNIIALGLGPLVAALLEWVGESRRPAPLWWAAVSGAIAGIVLMSLSQVELGGGRVGDLGWGIMFAVIAGVSYGLYTYAFSRVIRAGHHPAGVAGGVFGVAAPVLLLVAFFQGGELLASTERIGLVLYLVAGPMVIAYTAITSALRNLSASSVTSLSLLEPVVATLLAIVVVGERLGGYALWGIGCVLISLVAIAWSLRERP